LRSAVRCGAAITRTADGRLHLRHEKTLTPKFTLRPSRKYWRRSSPRWPPRSWTSRANAQAHG